MARVNVEQKALTDARYTALGRKLGRPRERAKFEAIGLMVYIWDECQEKESYCLSRETIDDIAMQDGAWEALIEVGLGEELEDGTIRIRGTKGRIEWLKKVRERNDKNGKKGGRPKKETIPETNLKTMDGFKSETITKEQEQEQEKEHLDSSSKSESKNLNSQQLKMKRIGDEWSEWTSYPPDFGFLARQVSIHGEDHVLETIRKLGTNGHLEKGSAYLKGALMNRGNEPQDSGRFAEYE